MRSVGITIVTALLFGSISLGGATVESAEDVLGWQGTRWGMTDEEVRKTLEGAGLRLTPSAGTYSGGVVAPFKTSIRIGAYDYEVVPQFDKEGLRQVIIRGQSTRPYVRKLFVELQDLLTEKYGTPAPLGDRREWRFKTTIIELGLFDIIDSVMIRYYPASKFKSDKEKL